MLAGVRSSKTVRRQSCPGSHANPSTSRGLPRARPGATGSLSVFATCSQPASCPRTEAGGPSPQPRDRPSSGALSAHRCAPGAEGTARPALSTTQANTRSGRASSHLVPLTQSGRHRTAVHRVHPATVRRQRTEQISVAETADPRANSCMRPLACCRGAVCDAVLRGNALLQGPGDDAGPRAAPLLVLAELGTWPAGGHRQWSRNEEAATTVCAGIGREMGPTCSAARRATENATQRGGSRDRGSSSPRRPFAARCARV
ncbi:hypothetical protein ERJ75_000099400 [Trypanosoma vivax]|nr:hypothetical protein ERJ75_000099400 [Trypanosoma vivax]